jgi:hypothetical protein
MTGARHLLLAVVAAVIACALGLALGAGPLVGRSEASHAQRADRLAERADRLQQRVAALEDGARIDEQVMSALAGPLTSGRLTGHSVLLVRTPGARDALVRSVRATLLSAGASLTGQLSLTSTYLDPAKATTPLEDLALRLVPPNVTFADGSTAIQRVGVVLARSTVAKEPPDDTDDDAAEVIAGLDELGAVRLQGRPGRLAQLAVVVTGPRERARAEDAVTGLVQALDAGGQGAVLVGPGLAPSAVGWWRSDPAGGASTVDSADTPAGRVALVLALAEQVAGGQGAYGAGTGATAVLPASMLSAAPTG